MRHELLDPRGELVGQDVLDPDEPAATVGVRDDLGGRIVVGTSQGTLDDGVDEATGVVVDVDLALFEADHGDPAKALAYAETGYKATPTVRAADALAWALHRLGRDAEAKKRSDEALRLGSRDPLLRYHAGAIAAALGRTADARRDLGLALSTDPGFYATGAAEARRILDTLPH